MRDYEMRKELMINNKSVSDLTVADLTEHLHKRVAIITTQRYQELLDYEEEILNYRVKLTLIENGKEKQVEVHPEKTLMDIINSNYITCLWPEIEVRDVSGVLLELHLRIKDMGIKDKARLFVCAAINSSWQPK